MSEARGFPGVCDGCQGPLVWTMVRHEVWTACPSCDSDQYEFEGILTPPVKEGEEFEGVHWEQMEEEGVAPPEGGSTKMSEGRDNEPPEGWLSSLWEGG